MPAEPSLARAFDAMIERKVNEALEPLWKRLDRLEAAVASAGRGRSAPARRAAAEAAGPGEPRRRQRRGSAARQLARLSSQFAEGQKVLYKQGRGEFEAQVLHVDAEKGSVTLERSRDGKKVVRPASKVQPV